MTPPASAMSHSKFSRLWHARWIATNDVEHAVCTLMLGPRKSNWYEARVASTSLSLPVCFNWNRPALSTIFWLASRL